MKGKSRNRQHRKEKCKALFRNKTKCTQLKSRKSRHRISEDERYYNAMDICEKVKYPCRGGRKNKSSLMEVLALNEIGMSNGLQYSGVLREQLDNTIREYSNA